MNESNAQAVRVATLNLRNTSDRWDERAPLLIEQLVALRPDVIGLQEVRVPARQARWLVDEVNARLGKDQPTYSYEQTSKTGLPGKIEGIATMTRLPVIETDWLDLRGGNRVAQRVSIALADATIEFYNTHLHHKEDAEAMRTEQARRLIDWHEERRESPQVLVGDFNARPGSPPIAAVTTRLRSAYADAHGREPERTAPTPLSEKWEDGAAGHVIDYIFVNDRVDVRDAWVTFDKPDAGDPRLCASDHYGLAADIVVRAGR